MAVEQASAGALRGDQVGARTAYASCGGALGVPQACFSCLRIRSPLHDLSLPATGFCRPVCELRRHDSYQYDEAHDREPAYTRKGGDVPLLFRVFPPGLRQVHAYQCRLQRPRQVGFSPAEFRGPGDLRRPTRSARAAGPGARQGKRWSEFFWGNGRGRCAVDLRKERAVSRIACIYVGAWAVCPSVGSSRAGVTVVSRAHTTACPHATAGRRPENCTFLAPSEIYAYN